MITMSSSSADSAEATQHTSEAQVQVKFVPSKHSANLPIAPETPFAVPTSLGRLGLSELVNHIVGDSENPRAYEFLINGKFLRTSIATYLTRNKLSEESELILEYIEALPPPQRQQSTPHPDWVSSIDASLGATKIPAQLEDKKTGKTKKTGQSVPGSLTVTGCFDGIVRVWAQPVASAVNNKLTTATSTLLAMGTGHTAAVKSVRVVRPIFAQTGLGAALGSGLIVSASHDRTLRLWEYSPASESSEETESKSALPNLTAQLECKAIFSGNEATVDVVETFYSPDRPESHSLAQSCSMDYPGSIKFLSGSYDGLLKFWTNQRSYAVNKDAEEEQEAEDSAEVRSKRVRGVPIKKVNTSLPEYEATTVFDKHHGPVSAICWPALPAVYSGSYDHTIKQWSLDQNTLAHSWTTGHVSCSLSYSSEMNLLASGDQDGAIRLWDPRSDGSGTPKMVLKSHPNWVSCVKWSPAVLGASYVLASAGYDGIVKLWDIRSTKPMHSFQSSSERLMALDWIPAEVPETGATSAPCSLVVGGTSKTMDRVGWSVYV